MGKPPQISFYLVSILCWKELSRSNLPSHCLREGLQSPEAYDIPRLWGTFPTESGGSSAFQLWLTSKGWFPLTPLPWWTNASGLG